MKKLVIGLSVAAAVEAIVYLISKRTPREETVELSLAAMVYDALVITKSLEPGFMAQISQFKRYDFVVSKDKDGATKYRVIDHYKDTEEEFDDVLQGCTVFFEKL